MVLKAAALILITTGTAAGVLSVRQQRLQAVHETAQAIESAARMDRELWSVRLEVATRLSPEHLRVTLRALEAEAGPLEPVFGDWCDTLPPDVLRAIEEGGLLDPSGATPGGDLFRSGGPPSGHDVSNSPAPGSASSREG